MTAPPLPPSERPALLTLGLTLQSLSAVLATFLYGLGGLVAAGALGLSSADVAIFGVWPFSLFMELGALAFGLAAAFHLLLLYTCWRARNGERPWLWALIAGSLLGIICTGPLSVAVALVTFAGAGRQLGLKGDEA